MTKNTSGRQAPQRVRFVHAHAEDESLVTGLLVAASVRVGAEVQVLTCTLGEEGEVIGEKYQQLTSEHANVLGGFRIGELQQALGHLGVDQGPKPRRSAPPAPSRATRRTTGSSRLTSCWGFFGTPVPRC